MRIPLFWKILGTYLGLVLVTAVLLGLFVSAPAAGDYEDEVQHLLDRQLPLLEADYRDAIEMQTIERLARRIRGLGLESSARFTVIDPDGVVLADSAENPADMGDHGSRPEILDARRNGTGRSRRHSTTLAREMMYVAKRVDGDDGDALGYVRASIPASELDVLSSRLKQSIFLAGLLATGIGLLLAWFLARRFTVPVRSMTRAASSIVSGDYERRVAIDSNDELGELAQAFNRMSVELQDRIATISTERGELETILSGMVEGVVAVDRDGLIVLMNGAARALLGVAPDSPARSPLSEGIPLRPVAEVIESALESDRLEQAEVCLATATHDQWLQLHAAPLRADGRMTGAVLVMHDITELRRLERVRRDFVANASHELKTPVAAIHGLVETILDDDAMDAQTERAFLERVKHQIVRLSSLITEMLELSRLESDQDARPNERLDLRAAVKVAVDTVGPLAAEQGVEVQLDLPSDPVVVRGSGESLQRIVGNLLDNAVKLTPTGGRVGVRVQATDDQILLDVRDQGPGIPAAERERIFERFYRVDRGRSRDVGGTGLGLAIVKHLVHGLGGDVFVAESDGHGSLFRVTLPAA